MYAASVVPCYMQTALLVFDVIKKLKRTSKAYSTISHLSIFGRCFKVEDSIHNLKNGKAKLSDFRMIPCPWLTKIESQFK